MGAVPIFVISLADALDRRRAISNRLASANLPFLFLDAVDVRHCEATISIPQIDRRAFVSDTAIACTLSHYNALKMVISSGSKWALIIEDDAIIPKDFASLIAKAVSLDCDIVKFEGADPSFSVCQGRIGPYEYVIPMSVTVGAAAYLITSEAASRFLALPTLDKAIDVLFDDYRLALKVYEVMPRPVAQDWDSFKSSNVPTRSPLKMHFFARILNSMRKRINTIRVYGRAIAFKLFLQKYAGLPAGKHQCSGGEKYEPRSTL